MSELTEDRVREIFREEFDRRREENRAQLNESLHAWREKRAQRAAAAATAQAADGVGDPRTDAMARRNAEFVAMVTPKSGRESAAAETPVEGDEPPARRAAVDDRDGRGHHESTT
ncbi:hypothetical protein [Nocardia abscessus]|uniref:hypothetical protein n=1 Tax=Nocardia abscessus TaxID=120957 RepID=UPI002458F735|nr:hypothetical protein [Nocardia abscessus]